MCLFVLVCVGMCQYVQVCVGVCYFVLLVASVLASMRWQLFGGDGFKKRKNEICNSKKISRETIYLHYGLK